MVNVSFPGLGIAFDLNPVAFKIPIFGGLEIRWYAIIIICGMIAAVFYAALRSKENGFSVDNLLDVTLYTVLIGIIGARLYYVFANIKDYHSFKDVIAVWEGGLAIYGGIIAGGITLFVCCRIFKLDWRCVFDAAAPGVMIAQAIGRWGNFVNGEAYGVAPSESNPLYFLRMSVKHANWANEYLCSPTFLYESVWNLLGFILINIFYRKRKFKSEIFFWYATWYGFGRFFIEGLRTDSLYAGKLRVSQVVAAVSFAVGLAAIIVFRILLVKNPRFKASWAAPAFAAAARAETPEENRDGQSEADTEPESAAGEEKKGESPDGGDN